MSRTIWKVRLNANQPSPQVHQLPLGSKPIHVGPDPSNALHDDYAVIAVWFEVITTAPKVGHVFSIHGTGHDIPAGKHIGSVVMPPFAWHVYLGKDVIA